jgi:hypothetical protein
VWRPPPARADGDPLPRKRPTFPRRADAEAHASAEAPDVPAETPRSGGRHPSARHSATSHPESPEKRSVKARHDRCSARHDRAGPGHPGTGRHLGAARASTARRARGRCRAEGEVGRAGIGQTIGEERPLGVVASRSSKGGRTPRAYASEEEDGPAERCDARVSRHTQRPGSNPAAGGSTRHERSRGSSAATQRCAPGRPARTGAIEVAPAMLERPASTTPPAEPDGDRERAEGRVLRRRAEPGARSVR